MTEYIKEIAKINSVSVGFEDHGIFTISVHVGGGGWGQGLPQYALGKHGAEYISRLLNAAGVRDTNDLVGKTIYVLYATPYGDIKGIENLPTESGHRFIFEDFWNQMV